LQNKQAELWDQVSRRSSLSALSLASSIRPITKEDKERENKNKSSPTKPSGRRIPGSARLIDNRTITDGNLYGRLKRETIRHHLERTTGPGITSIPSDRPKVHFDHETFADVEEGALLPSPTREKLMPVLPRSKTGSPQRGSPQKTISSRHGSPMKGSPQKSPKKISKGKVRRHDL
jgi:Nuclear protein MDM1